MRRVRLRVRSDSADRPATRALARFWGVGSVGYGHPLAARDAASFPASENPLGGRTACEHAASAQGGSRWTRVETGDLCSHPASCHPGKTAPESRALFGAPYRAGFAPSHPSALIQVRTARGALPIYFPPFVFSTHRSGISPGASMTMVSVHRYSANAAAARSRQDSREADSLIFALLGVHTI